jgi:hypothetical protein
MFKLFSGQYNIRTVHGEFVGTKKKHNELSAINTNWAFFLTCRKNMKISAISRTDLDLDY